MSSLDKLVEEQRRDRGIKWCKKYPGSAAERIATLEAQKASIWEQYQAAEARVKELVATVEHMDAICHTGEAKLAEALDIINMTGVAPKFVEKHKPEERG